jgi:hypothetical protein
MFWTFKLSFNVDILALLALQQRRLDSNTQSCTNCFYQLHHSRWGYSRCYFYFCPELRHPFYSLSVSVRGHSASAWGWHYFPNGTSVEYVGALSASADGSEQCRLDTGQQCSALKRPEPAVRGSADERPEGCARPVRRLFYSSSDPGPSVWRSAD